MRPRIVTGIIVLALLTAGCETATVDETLDTVASETEPTTTSTKGDVGAKTTTSAAPASSGDGIYRGEVTVAEVGKEMLAIHESSVEASDDDGVLTMRIDMVFEALWMQWDEESEPCVSTNRWVLNGTGPTNPSLELDLAVELIEVLQISGCELDESDDDDDEPIRFVGSLDGESLTGSFFEDLLLVSASRG
ncbi:MAG: hypothetical protein QNJ77_01785 [Acidimicrobiia bacterium]|nr:hypothetical protein [Acidimicrobiia bacterium]